MADDATTNDTAQAEPPESTTEPKAGKGAEDSGYKLRQIEKELKAANKARAEFESKLKEMEEAKLSEDEKLRRRVSELEQFQERAAALEGTLTELFEVELSEVPEDRREEVDDLIPADLPLNKRLTMLRKLRARGVFATADADAGQSRPTPPNVDNSRPVNGTATPSITREQLARMAPREYEKLRGDILTGRLRVKS